MRLFQPDQAAWFTSRPNRFLMMALAGGPTASGEDLLSCHCPNPGRMLELCLPDTELFLERRRIVPRPGGPAPKTLWTAALRYHGSVVCLAPVRMNKATEALVFPGMFPGAKLMLPEFSIGSSRFDFMIVDSAGLRHLVEVKSCSLVEHGVAMFPDAPSLRASRHLGELARLAGQGYQCHVLFMIAHGHSQRLVPNIHTDPAFAVALSLAADFIDIRAAEIRLDERGRATLARDEVPVDLSYSSLAGQTSPQNQEGQALAPGLSDTSRHQYGGLAGGFRKEPGVRTGKGHTLHR